MELSSVAKKRREMERAQWEKRRQEQQPWWDAYFRARLAYRRAQRAREAVISNFKRGASGFEMYDMAAMSVDELRSLVDEVERELLDRARRSQ
jgi:hypothetical protein